MKTYRETNKLLQFVIVFLYGNFKVNKSHVIKNITGSYIKSEQKTQYYLNKIFNQVKNTELKKPFYIFNKLFK